MYHNNRSAVGDFQIESVDAPRQILYKYIR